MSKWNYRLVRYAGDPPFLAVLEVYYDDTGKVTAWGPIGSAPHGETRETVLRDLEKMKAACFKEILDESELPGYHAPDTEPTKDESDDHFEPISSCPDVLSTIFSPEDE